MNYRFKNGIIPIDEETIDYQLKKLAISVVVKKQLKTMARSELMSLVNEKAFLYLEAAPTRVTGFDITVPLAKGEMYHFVQPERIAAEIFF